MEIALSLSSLYSGATNGVMTLTKRLLIFALLALMPCVSAHAQDEGGSESQLYDPTFTGSGGSKAAEQIKAMQKESMADKGFITPQSVHVSLVHYPYMDDNQFGIQMAVPDVVSGCYKITPLGYEAKFVEPFFLDIEVKKYRRVAPEGAPGRTTCDQKNQMSTALMVLDKEDLIKRGTQEIRFSSEIARDTYKIMIDDSQVTLIPKSMMMFKAQNMTGPLKDRLVYSFASDKMVALHVPMAEPGEDVGEQVTAFAKLRALKPASEDGNAVMTGNGTATYYFYDEGGHIRDKIGENGYAELGKIQVNRPYDGPEGRTEIPVELSVFVTRPGTQL